MGVSETEKRHGQRVEIMFPLKIIANFTECIMGESVNLSRTGLCCFAKQALPVSTSVEILLLIPPFMKMTFSQMIRARGVIVRKEVSRKTHSELSRPKSGGAELGGAEWFMGLRFTDITTEDWDLLEKFVQFFSENKH